MIRNRTWLASTRKAAATGWAPAAMLLCLAAIAIPCTAADDVSWRADAPVAAPRPDQARRLTLSELDRLLRDADVAIDVRQNQHQRWRAVLRLGETRSRYARPGLMAVIHRLDDDPQFGLIHTPTYPGHVMTAPNSDADEAQAPQVQLQFSNEDIRKIRDDLPTTGP